MFVSGDARSSFQRQAWAMGQVMQQLCHLTYANLFDVIDASTEEVVDIVLADWQRGQAYIQSTLRIKLQFWDLLPWKLAGVGHHDHAKALRCARECRDMYDQRLHTSHLVPSCQQVFHLLLIRSV